MIGKAHALLDHGRTGVKAVGTFGAQDVIMERFTPIVRMADGEARNDAHLLNGAVFDGHSFGVRTFAIHSHNVTAVKDHARCIGARNGIERESGQ